MVLSGAAGIIDLQFAVEILEQEPGVDVLVNLNGAKPGRRQVMHVLRIERRGMHFARVLVRVEEHADGRRIPKAPCSASYTFMQSCQPHIITTFSAFVDNDTAVLYHVFVVQLRSSNKTSLHDHLCSTNFTRRFSHVSKFPCACTGEEATRGRRTNAPEQADCAVCIASALRIPCIVQIGTTRS